MIAILDAGAVIAYLHGETGDEVVEATLLDRSASCFIHAITLYEVYYDFLRRTDEPTAVSYVHALRENGLVVCEGLDETLWRDAAHLKVSHRLSVADSFAVALARRLGGELLTTDHHELDAVAAARDCSIRFIR